MGTENQNPLGLQELDRQIDQSPIWGLKRFSFGSTIEQNYPATSKSSLRYRSQTAATAGHRVKASGQRSGACRGACERAPPPRWPMRRRPSRVSKAAGYSASRVPPPPAGSAKTWKRAAAGRISGAGSGSGLVLLVNQARKRNLIAPSKSDGHYSLRRAIQVNGETNCTRIAR